MPSDEPTPTVAVADNEEEEEEEDVDFNPFLIASPPSEPSSSLSSEDDLHRPNLKDPRSLHVDEDNDNDDDDAICKRTRARHSLADHTLEELEAFLQESDDDDHLHHVDEQEEYRRFLAAVLAGDEHNDDDHDEDEENDADFDVEIEEALESDEEPIDHRIHDDDRRPETRQNRKNQKKPVAVSNAALRPILPSAPTAMPMPLMYQLPSSGAAQPMTCSSGFSEAQVGQLHCMIHEHVQLLIQIFSLCVLDPARQQVAAAVKKLIVEMVDKRQEALAGNNLAYPAACFDKLNLNISEGNGWIPAVCDPVRSVLDVASLGLARDYLDDVRAASSSYRGCLIDDLPVKSLSTREPLFHIQNGATCIQEAGNDATEGAVTCQNSVSSLPTDSQNKPKKSLAAVLVENTKKQTIAHVPKCVSDLVRRFVPMFNPAIFPHKPPLPAIANRILFTDSEDWLLAMGLMECNNDWTAIQQRFLPSKSTHQIFVRQKNRSSSKAPENPIKVVRRLKTCPLNVNEMSLISKGLKLFKNDWTSVWKFFLPYRDPSLLPRQWRIACGTQKSYRKSEIVKEKRRIYEAERRKHKNLLNRQASAEKNAYENEHNSANGNLNVEDEAYVHEAFLAVSVTDAGSSKPQSTISQAGVLPQIQSAVKVVKLAPGLPPVNLPPSVRVISQSVFRNYSGIPPYFPSKDRNPSIELPLSGESGNGSSGSKCVISNSRIIDNRMLNPGSRVGPHLIDEGHLGPEHMHPLLFQAPDDGYPVYYSNNSGSITSNTLNFFSGNQSQYNLNSRIPGEPDEFVNLPQSSTHSKEFPSHLQTIDFHPLFQRSDIANQSAIVRFENGNASDHSNNVQDCCLPFYPDGGVTCEPHIKQGHLIVKATTSSQYERENDLDLDIRLYSATDKQGASRSTCKTIRSNNIGISGNKTLTRKALSPSSSHKDCHVSADGHSDINSASCDQSHRSGLITLAVSRDATCNSSLNEEDEFLAEIVMEHEELSDTDEDIENVEFECEEMDDSGDELEIEHSVNIPNKEVSASSNRAEIHFQSCNGSSGAAAISTHPSEGPFMSACSKPRLKKRVAQKSQSHNGGQSTMISHGSLLGKQNMKGSKASPSKRPRLCLNEIGECSTGLSRRQKR